MPRTETRGGMPMRRTALAALLIAVFALALPIAPASSANGPSASFGWASDAPADPGHGQGHDTLPIHAQALARAKQHANAHATPGGPRQVGGPAPGPYFNGQQDTSITPPDTTGAIGPSEYVETVNLRYGIYDRSGTLISGGPLGDLTGINNGCLTDPNIIWDADGSRFYYSALDVCDSTYAFGFSKSAAPSGASDWCKYTAFQYGSLLADFPKLGDSGDFLMIGANIFQLNFLTYVYLRSDVGWIAKADLQLGTGGACPDPAGIHGGIFTGVKNQDGTDASTPVPANGVEFDSPTGYVVAGPDASSSPGGVASSLSLFKVTANAMGAAKLSAPTTVTVPGYSVPADARQAGARRRFLDTSDARLTQAVAAVDPSAGGDVGVWTQHAVFGGPGSEVRWYEISGTTGALLDSGKAGAPKLFVFNGAISPDRAVADSTHASFGGSMAMTFSTSSPRQFSAIQYVSKPVAGVQSAFVKVVQSPGKNVDFSCSPVCRWGDYAGASPDPAGSGVAGTVWLANQWNVASVSASDVDWRTSIFNVTP